MNLNKLKSLYQQHVNSSEKVEVIDKKDPSYFNSNILIVDGLNIFIRCFAALPNMNENGNHVGGLVGFLKSVGSSIKMFNPSRVIIVFDGKGGSVRKRSVYPGYKEGRKTSGKYNRQLALTADEERESIKHQLFRLTEYIDNLPITSICVDSVEADDVIGFLTTEYFTDNKIVICSNDKDYLQLVNDKVSVWNGIKKKLYTPTSVKEEYGVTSKNFLYYKILIGDKSDSIDKIKGFGDKKIQKLYPILSEDKEIDLSYFLSYTEDRKNEHRLYGDILSNSEIIKRNQFLMNLNRPDFSSSIKSNIRRLVELPTNRLNRMNIITSMGKDQITKFFVNPNSWVNDIFTNLNFYSRET